MTEDRKRTTEPEASATGTKGQSSKGTKGQSREKTGE